MTTASKIIFGVSTLGALGGSGVLVNKLLDNSDTIDAKLKSEGFDTNVGDDELTKILVEHNKIQSLEGTFKTVANTNLELNKLKAECKSALNSKKGDEKTYKKARQWCVKEKPIKDIFTAIGLRALDTTQTTDDQGAWNTNIEDLKKDISIATKLNAEMISAETIDLARIKKGCEAITSVKTTAADFNDKFELAKRWCAVAQTKSKST